MRFACTLALLAACGPSDSESACKDSLLPGDLVITEVQADFQAPAGGTGTDEGKEWFEIYNAADRPLELTGMTIVHARPDGSKAQQHRMASVTVAPGQFFTLGNATQDLVPAYVDYGYSNALGDFYNTGGGKLTLKCGDTEIDSASYDSIKAGHTRQLSSAMPPDYTFNDNLENWCEGIDSEFEAGNFGTPGSENDCVPIVAGACNDGGTMRAVVSPAAGDLVITEVMPQPRFVSDTLGEWFEIKALKDVDLNGVTLDRAGDSTAGDVIMNASCVHLAAGQYAVFARNADMSMNGGLTVAGTFRFSLVNGSTTAPGDIQILAGVTVVDAVTWHRSAAGRALNLDPDLSDAISNDTESNFCDATTPWMGVGSTQDFGTPGTANMQCVLLPPAGMCDDMGTLRAIVKPVAGALVISEVMINPKVETSPGAQEWFEITNTSNAAFDVNGLGLDQVAGTRPPDVINSAACKSVPPGGFALFAHTTDPMANGGLTGIDATYGFTLSNSGGDIQVLDGTTPLDQVSWGSVPASTDTKAMQLDPDFLMTGANDMITGAGTKWCVGTTAYGDGMNLGTPRAANAQCPGI